MGSFFRARRECRQQRHWLDFSRQMRGLHVKISKFMKIFAEGGDKSVFFICGRELAGWPRTQARGQEPARAPRPRTYSVALKNLRQSPVSILSHLAEPQSPVSILSSGSHLAEPQSPVFFQSVRFQVPFRPFYAHCCHQFTLSTRKCRLLSQSSASQCSARLRAGRKKRTLPDTALAPIIHGPRYRSHIQINYQLARFGVGLCSYYSGACRSQMSGFC